MYPSVPDDERIARTKYLVEGNNFESMMLWKEWHQDRKVEWNQHSMGRIYTVGSLNKRPINVQLSWDDIAGQLVCFWEPTSQLVDHEMIEKWLDQYFTPRCRSNCMNFGNIMSDIARELGYRPWKET